MPEPAEQTSKSELGLVRGGIVEETVFGTRDLSEVDSIVDHFCVSELGAKISEVLFRATSVGVVIGALLDDGCRVVVKAHQPRETRTRLEAVQKIQSVLHRAGLPCPEPLAGPVPLVNGHATVEALLDEGEFRNTHDPDCRRLIAQALAWHLEITAARPTPDALFGGWSLFDSDGLWPVHAHSPIFDFQATSTGAEWIDALATEARAGRWLRRQEQGWTPPESRSRVTATGAASTSGSRTARSPRSTTGTAWPCAPKQNSWESQR